MIAMSSVVLFVAALVAPSLPSAAAPPAQPAAPLPAPASATSTLAPPSPREVLEVPPALRALVEERVILPTRDPAQRLKLLVSLLFSADGLALHYDADANGTITETWQSRRVNCLTFSLLFSTLASQAGIEARLQEVGQVLSWYQDDAAIYNIGHVNVGIRAAGRSGTVDLDSDVLYDQRGPQPIDQDRVMAHLYNNRGAVLLTAGDLAGAERYFRLALALDPRFTPGLNNLGVVLARTGDDAGADAAWQRALSLQPRNAAALSNASAFHQRRGDSARAAVLARALEQARRHDPFHQYLLGLQAERSGNDALAVASYKRAIRLHPGTHQFHFGLARVEFNLGHLARAERELERAQALGADPEKRRYQAKLDSLQRLQRRHPLRDATPTPTRL